MENKKEELTYILGAGASFQSIPVVKTFAKRFDSFAAFLESNSKTLVKTYPDSSIDNSIFIETAKAVRILSAEFKAHQSFDVYFKKLFHTKNENQINLSKKILHLYFLWEHTAAIPKTKQESNELFWKQAFEDRRYDALIAGLLIPIKDTCEMFCKTNFITWNYDLNLIESIKKFFYPEETFREFLDTRIKIINEFEWSIDGKISIINMNGYFYSNLFDDMKFIVRNKGKDLLRTKITKDYLDNSFNDNDAELIKFAWEEDNTSATIAIEKIQLSENIIFIGYTFPLYNRLVDIKYIPYDLLNKNEKLAIYIQDPIAKKIKPAFMKNFNISKGFDRRINEIEECDSFFIPSNIYNPIPPATYNIM